MIRKFALLFIVVSSIFLFSCSFGSVKGGEDYTSRSYKHIELHILKLAKQLDELHRQIDWYFFDLDEEDPYNY